MIVRIQQPDDTEAAFSLFRDVLAKNDFETHSEHADSIVGTCRSLIQKKNNNPLRNAAPITLTLRNKALELEAAFGAAANLARFRVLFPLGLGIMMSLIFGVSFRNETLPKDMRYSVVLFPLLLCAAGAFIASSAGRFSRARTVVALEQLVRRLGEASGGTISAPSGEPRVDRSIVPLIRSTVVLVIGTLLAFLVLPGSIKDTFYGSNRLVLPAEQTMRISKPGTYTVFYEYRAKFRGVTYHSSRAWTGINLALHSADSGTVIPIEPLPGRTNYSFGTRAGYSVAQFNVAQPGDLALIATGIPANETRVVRVARFDSSQVLWFAAKVIVPLTLGLEWVFSLLAFVVGRKASSFAA